MKLARLILVNAPMRVLFRRTEHAKRAHSRYSTRPKSSAPRPLVEQWSRDSVKSVHVRSCYARALQQDRNSREQRR